MQGIWLDSSNVDTYIPSLHALLAEAVADGASIGFMWPVNNEEIAAYWHDVAAAVVLRKKYLFVVVDEADNIVGTAQLEPSPKENGRHRAEVQKVIVALHARNRGIGKYMMRQVEDYAKALNRSMLFLDTRVDDIGERLYVSMGWSQFGVAPDYAYSPDGTLAGSAFYYKRI
ncbi:MAG: GNAT family N-acetyltransferase [Roseiflexaceae bacterium]